MLASFTAPDAAVRERARELVGRDRFAVVHLSTPLVECRLRDAHGLYADADRGVVRDVPGIDFVYEEPSDAELVLPLHALGTQDAAVHTAVERVMEFLRERGALLR